MTRLSVDIPEMETARLRSRALRPGRTDARDVSVPARAAIGLWRQTTGATA
jgi:hypothetical protein